MMHKDRLFFILVLDQLAKPISKPLTALYVKTRLLLFFHTLVIFIVLWILTGRSDNHILSLSVHDPSFLVYTAFTGSSPTLGCQADDASIY